MENCQEYHRDLSILTSSSPLNDLKRLCLTYFDQSLGYCLELDPELVERMGFDADELSTHPRKHFRTLEFTVGQRALMTPISPSESDLAGLR